MRTEIERQSFPLACCISSSLTKSGAPAEIPNDNEAVRELVLQFELDYP